MSENDIKTYDNIEDIIIKYYPNSTYPSRSCNIILKEYPSMVYEEVSNGYFIGESMGCYLALKYEKYKGAFAGREFIIEMKNMTYMICQDHYWDVDVKINNEIMENIGIATFDKLKKCYVFCGVKMKSLILNKWLENNKPKTDYWYYDKLWNLKKRLLNKYRGWE